jgi:D-alanine-D-alanine ligase
LVSGRKIRVAVVFGGRSTEHAISCASAGLVLSALDPDRYEVVPVGITRDGQWVLTSGDPARLTLGGGAELPSVSAEAGTAVAPLPGGGWVSLSSLSASSAAEVPAALGSVDVVLPLLHGAYGEDGTIQGLLELTGTRYVGAGVFASAAGMDKEYMKLISAARGLPVGPYVVVRAATWGATAERKRVLDEIGELGWPVFVKPARGGSSIGISRCTSLEELDEAIATALSFDPKVLVEAAIDGIEVECAVLEGIDGGPTEASVPGQVLVDPRSEFYDFAAKYAAAGATMQIPAAIPPSAAEEVRQLACAAFDAISCEGLARVDFFYTTAGDIVLNEINTMPGMTPASGFPLMWAATGLPAPQLFDRIIKTALTKQNGLRLTPALSSIRLASGPTAGSLERLRGRLLTEHPCLAEKKGSVLTFFLPRSTNLPSKKTAGVEPQVVLRLLRSSGGYDGRRRREPSPPMPPSDRQCAWRELLLLARGLGAGGVDQSLEVRARTELRH